MFKTHKTCAQDILRAHTHHIHVTQELIQVQTLKA
jgi:hypothetical protein